MVRAESNPSPAGERRHHPGRRPRRLVDEADCCVWLPLFVPHHARSGVSAKMGNRLPWRRLCGPQRAFQFARSVNRSLAFAIDHGGAGAVESSGGD